MVDLERLAQVLSNLLTNAAKYSEVGSRIAVSAKREGNKVRVSVKDEGIGIAPDMIDSIFDVFVQQSQTIERSRGGLGVGLAIVRNLVQMHDGTVRAHSEGAGRGSEFIVELPAVTVATVTQLPVAPSALPSAQLGGKKILVVDDNPDSGEMLKALLEQIGYTVVTAADGPSALETAKAFQPDIALLDIGLPIMDGYEVGERLRSLQKNGSGLRLVAVTGYGLEADRERSRAAGFEAHLVKPVDIDKLIQVCKDRERAD
jgi:CheY-like chemotaxis protein